MAPSLTWEQAVQWLRQQPEQAELVLACFYDDPLLEAARRFTASEEWLATMRLLGAPRGMALDLGAGRGITSYALAKAGWRVVSLEPDPSALVGAGAIRALTVETGLPICVIEEHAENLPFQESTFELVLGRQILHHARDLPLLCREAMRVLKPGGRFVATREHVISRRADLAKFLACHPLHHLYGGENAHLLGEYLSAIRRSGLRLVQVIKPLASPINYAPMKREEWRRTCARMLSHVAAEPIALRLLDENRLLGRLLFQGMSWLASQWNNTPGRLYSFVMDRPL